jgi:hypothetical protein
MASEKDTAVTLPVAGNLTYREIHAVVDGFYCGYRGLQHDPRNEYDVETHYWRAGWVGGDAIREVFK